MLKNWVLENLVHDSGKLISGRLILKWFVGNGYLTYYNQIIENTSYLEENVSLSQRLWHIVYNINFSISCKICSHSTRFVNFLIGYRQYCSLKCVGQDKELLERKKRTCLKNYGVDNPSKSLEIKQRKIMTCRKNFGVDFPMESLVVRKKSKNIIKRKYNVENISQLPEIKKQVRDTVISKYGGFSLQSPEIMKRVRKTIYDRYGVRHPLQSEIIKTKIKETCVNKYGVDNVFKSEHVKTKIKNKKFKKYFDTLYSGRLTETIRPLFSLNDYYGIKNGTRGWKYPFLCLKCRNQFMDILTSGKIPSCPICYPVKNSESRAEKEIVFFLRSFYRGKIIENDKSILNNNNELDIYLPEEKLAIEYDGLYYHSELSGGKDKYYHLNKTLECEKQGIRLIHIFEDEWLYKQKIVEHTLKYILRINTNIIIDINECIIEKISAEIKNRFLEKYHIKGIDKSLINLGVFYDNELFGVMTFTKLSENVYELSRFATKIPVINLISKFLFHFVEKYNPVEIVNYFDRRWDDGSLKKIGFDHVSDEVPDYWYIFRDKRLIQC